MPSTRKFSAMPSAIKILLFIFLFFFFFGENLYRYKNILLKSANNIFAIPSGHGIEAPLALSCSLHRLFVKLVFQNVFRGKTI
jgi:4-hydroxybenzoate polyprenyltransferase